MGNEIGLPLRGQLAIDLILTEDQVHLKIGGTGALQEVSKYFSKERLIEQISIGGGEHLFVEQYKFVVDVEIEEEDAVNLIEEHQVDAIDNYYSDISSSSSSDSSSDDSSSDSSSSDSSSESDNDSGIGRRN